MPSVLVRQGGRIGASNTQDNLRWLFIFRLQQEVLERNLALSWLAEKSGVPATTLSDWVNGKHCPLLGDPRRKAIAKALGQPLAWMNGLDGNEEAKSSGRPENRRE